MSDTITSEVIINNNCKCLSLSSSPRKWAKELLELENFNNRIKGAEIVSNKGFSVQNEVKKIESLYVEIINK